MADNFLEKHYEDYERRKAEWLQKKRHKSAKKIATTKYKQQIEKPTDESL